VSIYKPCGIRGDAASELNAGLYRRWGLALGLELEPNAKFVVGGDIRDSTPEFLAAFMDGLCQAGLDVVDLGQLPTPMIYYARHRLNADGCAVVTASHYPANINGLRWMIGNRPPMPDDVYTLQIAAESPASKKSARRRTEPRSIDISFDYVANLQETWVDAMGSQLHIVIDPMHGSWAGKARRYLHAIFPQCLISAINDTPDPTFDGQAPDCSRWQQLHNLCDAVYRERAHLGIAFDGDGDQLALVDNQGMPLTGEETAWLFMESLGKAMHNEQFVYDLRFSDRVGERAKQLGAEPLVERSGHAYIHKRMIATGALFGAEISGHYFFRAMEGGDDGFYAACRMIAFLAQSDKTLAQWRWECPPVYITPELHINMPLESQARIMEKIRHEWSSFTQQGTDGLRVDTPGGWFLARGSATESALSFRFESLDWSALDHLVQRVCDTLPELGKELWRHYIADMGMAETRK
jgi:phosphomannomutase / phosphoglucomutase